MLTFYSLNDIIIFAWCETHVIYSNMRKCWNWQTGKTKDLVGVFSCGFKSHLPQYFKVRETLMLLRFPAFYCQSNWLQLVTFFMAPKRENIQSANKLLLSFLI